MLSLYSHQQALIDDTRLRLRTGLRAILLQIATGGGKTVMGAFVIKSASGKGKTCWFIVHRRELIKQTCATFADVGIPHGVVSAGAAMMRTARVQVCGIDTLRNRMDKLPAPDVIVWDECHHLAAAGWAAVRERYPAAIHVGLSATPQRLDGRGLRPWFDDMVCGPSPAWLIEQGFLAPYRLFAPPAAVAVTLDDVRTSGTDYNRGELAAAMDKSTVTGDAVAHYLRLARGKRAVAFEVTIERSKRLVEAALAAGIPAEHVDGETDASVRDAAIARFRRGETLLLSNVDLFGEGFDLPAIEVAILNRPTKSLTIYLQQCGRALRTSPGKTEALILDHAGNAMRHGLPDDEREWSLDGRKKKRKKGEAEVNVKQCPQCYRVALSTARVCKGCGHEFVATPTREIEHVDADLVEVDRKVVQLQRKRDQASAESFEQLVELGKARGYKNPAAWATYVWQARTRKRA